MLPAQSNSQLRHGLKPTARCRSRKKEKAPQHTGSHAGYGFLKTRFLPVRENKYPELKNRKEVEQSFFDSLGNLSALYGFALPDVSGQPFPVNIALAYRYAKERVQEVQKDLQLIITHSPQHPATLATVASYDIGRMLYYTPIRPVVDLLKKPEEQPVTDLLLSVFSYLYKIVRIPWMDEGSSFLSYCYEILQEWELETAESEGDKDYLEDTIRRFEAMEEGRTLLYRQIIQPGHLPAWESRVKQFVPLKPEQKMLLDVAKELLVLYRQYPNRSAFDNIPDDLFAPEEEERITPHHYLSFFWDSEDDLYDHLMEYINSYLQEYTVMDEPVAVQSFHQPQTTVYHDLDFEQRLFKSLDDLTILLNKLA